MFDDIAHFHVRSLSCGPKLGTVVSEMDSCSVQIMMYPAVGTPPVRGEHSARGNVKRRG